MDWKELAKDLERIVDAAAPLVGLDDELQAGKDLIAAIGSVVGTVSDNLESADIASLEGKLHALAEKVNARADAVQERLRG